MKKIITLIIMLTMLTTLVACSKEQNQDTNDTSIIENNNENNDEQHLWKECTEIAQYPIEKLEAINLKDIDVQLSKINIEYTNGKRITIDFSNNKNMYKFSFNGEKEEPEEFDLESWSTFYPAASLEYFKNFKENLLQVVFYGYNSSDYCKVVVNIDGIYKVYEYNNASAHKSEVEVAEIMKEKLSSIVEYDSAAPTMSEYLISLIKKVQFNLKSLNVNNLEITPSLTFETNGFDPIRISQLSDYDGTDPTWLSKDNISIKLDYSFSQLPEDLVVKEYMKGDVLIRIYRDKEASTGGVAFSEHKYYNYWLGVVENDKEYVFRIGTQTYNYETNEVTLIDENDILDFAMQLIK